MKNKRQNYQGIVKFSVILLVVVASTAFFTSFTPKQTTKTWKIVLDAGHGGKDIGCHGKLANEKTIALDITLKVGNYLKANLKNVEVIYTRDKDEYVGLADRASIANKEGADLFVSIHCNANASSAPYGTETYVMGLHVSDANLNVAKRENSSILLEDNYKEKYQYDPSSPVAHLIFSLYQSVYQEQSTFLAQLIQSEFRTKAKRKDRGVKQAGFMVLYRTSMPSVLVETGFLTNPTEEKFMVAEHGKSLIASGVYRAIKSYMERMGNAPTRQEEKKEKEEIVKKEAESKKEEPKKVEEKVIEETQEIIDEKPEPAEPSIVFHLQFIASKLPVDLSKPPYNKIDSVFTEDAGNRIIRYMTGTYHNPVAAEKGLTELKQKGLKDCYIVAYKDGRRIPYKVALQEF